MTAGHAWAGSPWAGVSLAGRRVVTPGDALFALSDDFRTGTTLTGNGWLIEDSTPASSPSDTITSQEADLTIAAGAPTGSFWFDSNDGCLWYKEVTGACDFRARVRVTDTAGTGLPPTTQFRIAGIAVHDPDRGLYNYVHVGLGSNNTASLQEEWKTTDDSDSAYAYTAATLTSGALLYDLRIVRRATDTQIFDVYVRPGHVGTLAENTGWTLLVTVDRSDANVPDRVANNGSTAVTMPATLRWGFMVYANDATHDIRMQVLECRFQETTA